MLSLFYYYSKLILFLVNQFDFFVKNLFKVFIVYKLFFNAVTDMRICSQGGANTRVI